jgi:hypothetical protein
MPIIKFIQGDNHFNTFAELYYDHENDHLPISETDLNKLRELKINRLNIVAFIAFDPNHITLPSFADFPDITQITMRYVTLKDGVLPTFPPHLICLELVNTNICTLDNLPNWLQMLTLSNNSQLTSVVIPPRLTSLNAIRQTKIRVLTLTPNITYLRLIECRFERINRLSLNTIRRCFHEYVGSVNRRCQTPYTLFNNTQNTTSTYIEIFNQIQQINRELDEANTSILYSLRESVYTQPPSYDKPIMNALVLSSNILRRSSDFMIESV